MRWEGDGGEDRKGVVVRWEGEGGEDRKGVVVRQEWIVDAADGGCCLGMMLGQLRTI